MKCSYKITFLLYFYSFQFDFEWWFSLPLSACFIFSLEVYLPMSTYIYWTYTLQYRQNSIFDIQSAHANCNRIDGAQFKHIRKIVLLTVPCLFRVDLFSQSLPSSHSVDSSPWECECFSLILLFVSVCCSCSRAPVRSPICLIVSQLHLAYSNGWNVRRSV